MKIIEGRSNADVTQKNIVLMLISVDSWADQLSEHFFSRSSTCMSEWADSSKFTVAIENTNQHRIMDFKTIGLII